MNWLARVFYGVIWLIRWSLSAVGAVFRGLFGQASYAPPLWLSNTVFFMRERPLRAVLILSFLGVLGWGVRTWLNYVPPVPPNLVHVTLSAPTPTDYRQEELSFSSFSIEFDASVAPIGASSMAANAPQGVLMEPQIAGTWVWSGDRRLVFSPSVDWPVGAKFEVSFDPKITLAPHVIVDLTEFEFTTAPYSYTMSAEFNQDPTNALLKQAVYTLNFSHPIDAKSLESRLSFAPEANTARFPEATLAKDDPLYRAKFSVRYDDKRLTAYVTSDALILPDAGAFLSLNAAEGMVSALGGPGAPAATSKLELPSLYSLSVENLELATAENAGADPEQIAIVGLNEAISDQGMIDAFSLYLLPKQNPDKSAQSEPYAWQSSEVSEAILQRSQKLKLSHVPGERNVLELHSFRYEAPVGRSLYASVKKNTAAFGGTKLPELYQVVLRVPEYPKALSFVGDGALLSLKGEKRLSVLTRNILAFRLEVSRVMPDQLQHWVRYNNGSFQQPDFYAMDEDSLVERFSRVVRLPVLKPGATHYEGIDLSPYFSADKHGVFHIELRELQPSSSQRDTPIAELTDAQLYEAQERDDRLIVLTDLGVVAKTTLDKQREVFVQKILSGEPAADVQVDVIGANGLSVQSIRTDASGHATLDDFDGFERERKPMMLRFMLDGDLSFLPIRNAYSREQDYSRFDTGGTDTPEESGALSAHVFSDRGLYRPGDTINFGIIARAFDWTQGIAGVPLRAVITDPSGREVYNNLLTLNDTGFIELEYITGEADASGGYTLSVYQSSDSDLNSPIGQTSVQVKEFLPDQMKIATKFSTVALKGWLKPADLNAIVQVDTLFGTPAQDRRVTANLSLSPTVPSFDQYPGFTFFDPAHTNESFSDVLQEQQTDPTGKVEFVLGLEKYSSGTFYATVSVEAFEAGAGRSVTSYAQTLVSTNDALLGIRSADSLSYVSKDAARSLEIVAINQSAEAVAMTGLRAVVTEKKYVSVLTKQNSGVYKYVSQERTENVSDKPLNLAAKVTNFALDTSKPGRFELKLIDANGIELNAITYSVAGEANLTRALDRNAELELTLSKSEYTAGEELEVNIRAPYPGSGLLTIERDQVYAHAWFKADTESSVQRIRIPENLEGGAYLSVQFVRSPESPEVYMSPLSYGAMPFSLNRARRTQAITVSVPKRAKPGQVLNFDVSTDGVADVAVFAVDEGILQVARYKLEEPLATFFPKRRLQVDTSQILDLILPEFSRLLSAAAPGGGDEELLGSNLNPFKRKRDKPATYWSGIQRVDGSAQLQYTPPEYFNGTLKVFAVAVSRERIGTFRGETQVRGDFVLQANVPTTLSPGDQFSASINVSYPKPPEMKESAAAVKKAITVKMIVDPGLSVAKAEQVIELAPGGEGVVRFDVSASAGATQKLGNAGMHLTATSGSLSAKRSANLSIRPATAFSSTLRVGRIDEARAELKNLRVMWPEFSRRDLVAGPTPLVLARGLAGYLEDFPEACSEQLASQAFARLLLLSHPELTPLQASGEVPFEFTDLLAQLGARQNSEGGYGLWNQSPQSVAFVSAYVGLLLQESRDRGVARAESLWPNTQRYLKSLATDASKEDLSDLRTRAFAIYVLTRAGNVTTAEIAGLQQVLDRTMPATAKRDVTSLLLAASLKLLKVQSSDARAQAAVQAISAIETPVQSAYANYYDETIGHALDIYLLHKHFPQQAKLLSPKVLERLLAPIAEGTNNTLSSALTILALDAAAQNAKPVNLEFKQIIASGAASEFGNAQGWLYSGAWNATANMLEIHKPAGGPIWYALTESGFDQSVEGVKASAGIEVSKSYVDAQGMPLTRPLTVGEELTVTLQLRSIDQQYHSDVALIDLLPGGFEANSDSGNQNAISSNGTSPDNQEVREDRVVLYVTATPSVTQYSYTIKATNVGRYLRPRSYAYSMYERKVQSTEAQASVTSIEVVAPK